MRNPAGTLIGQKKCKTNMGTRVCHGTTIIRRPVAATIRINSLRTECVARAAAAKRQSRRGRSTFALTQTTNKGATTIVKMRKSNAVISSAMVAIGTTVATTSHRAKLTIGAVTSTLIPSRPMTSAAAAMAATGESSSKYSARRKIMKGLITSNALLCISLIKRLN